LGSRKQTTRGAVLAEEGYYNPFDDVESPSFYRHAGEPLNYWNGIDPYQFGVEDIYWEQILPEEYDDESEFD
jgi:hypothetical protein